MESIAGIWILVALLGGLAVMGFLRILAWYMKQSLDSYETVRQAIRMRREYEKELQRRQNLQIGEDGIIEV